MQFKLETTPWTTATANWLIVVVPEPFELTGPLESLDKALGGQLSRLKESEDFSGKSGETLSLPDVPGIHANRLLLVGLGKSERLNAAGLQRALATAARQISTKRVEHVAVAIAADGPDLTLAQRVRTAATAMEIASTGQDLFRAEKKRYPFSKVDVLVDPGADIKSLKSALQEGQVLGEAVNLARQLVNLPAKDLYPATFADRAVDLAKQHGLNCEVLDEKTLAEEKMGSLLGVAAGSDRPPRIVYLEHNGGSPNSPVLALIGKGVTFDSGGLSLKSNENMLTMKCDMAGAATVLAAMTAIARLKLPVRAVGLMGLVENMTGGSAMKLGDVLTARNGVTIEVLNTDAEGRLVLADVLDYAIHRGADYIVDLATLTGACVVALGEEVAGAMTNDQDWCDTVLAASRNAGEELWQLPMHDHYAKLIESDVADIKNVGGRWGGAITAGKFLERFVQEKPWVHLDIAGPAFASSDKPHREGGATGCMVQTLVELARNFPNGKTT